MSLKIVLFIFATFLLSFTIGAQGQIRVRNFNIEQNLSQNSVFTALEDTFGLLWICTNDGLNSFDGTKITQPRTFKDKSANFRGSVILQILELPEGQLLISTLDGVNILNRNTGQFTKLKVAKKYSEFNSTNDWVRFNDRYYCLGFKGITEFNLNQLTSSKIIEELEFQDLDFEFLNLVHQNDKRILFASNKGWYVIDENGFHKEEIPNLNATIDLAYKINDSLSLAWSDNRLIQLNFSSRSQEAIDLPEGSFYSHSELPMASHHSGRWWVIHSQKLFIVDQLNQLNTAIPVDIKTQRSNKATSAKLNGILKLKNGSILLSTNDQGFFLHEPSFNASHHINSNEISESNENLGIWGLTELSDSSILVATDEGLSIINYKISIY